MNLEKILISAHVKLRLITVPASRYLKVLNKVIHINCLEQRQIHDKISIKDSNCYYCYSHLYKGFICKGCLHISCGSQNCYWITVKSWVIYLFFKSKVRLFYQIPNPCSSQGMKSRSSSTQTVGKRNYNFLQEKKIFLST